MKRWVLAVGLFVLMGSQPVYAFGWDDVRAVGRDTVSVTGEVIVWVDKAMHWTWNVLHNNVVHPAVEVVTLGIVNLDAGE